MPSEPLVDGTVEAEVKTDDEGVRGFARLEDSTGAGWSGETLSRNVEVGMKNRPPVTAVLKSKLKFSEFIPHPLAEQC